MTAYGLLVDTTWCTGCHSCEVACQMEHHLPVGQYGIEVFEVGPWEYEKNGETKWQYSYIVTPTDQCDACTSRVVEGKRPSCVHHCQAKCLEYGPVEELARKLVPGSKCVLFAL